MCELLKGGSKGGLHRQGNGSPGQCGAKLALQDGKHFEVSSSEAFLLMVVPWGCFCSPPNAAHSVLKKLRSLCIVCHGKL